MGERVDANNTPLSRMDVFSSRNQKLVRVFFGTVISMTLVYWLGMFFTHSENIGAYFLTDHFDTEMDYFNMLANISHGDPYYAYANYPAICFLFWKVMYHFLPLGQTELYGVGYNLRTNMIAQLGYFLFAAICLLVIWELIQYFAKGKKHDKLLFGVALVFSGPMFFLLERGNILVAVIAFLLLFLALYDSPKFGYRVLAYIFLSLAAAIKIYPAVFGLLVLGKKRHKETMLLVVLGVLTFAAPFFAFNGIESMKTMIAGFFVSSSIQIGSGWGHSFSFDNLIRLIGGCFGANITSTPGWLPIFPLVICVILFFLAQKEWQKLFALVMLCIWLPSFSYTYTLVLLFIPIISFFFRTNNSDEKIAWIYTVLFALMLIPYGLPLIDRINIATGLDYTVIGPDGVRYPVSWGSIIMNGALVMLIAMVFVDCICNRIKRRKKKDFGIPNGI